MSEIDRRTVLRRGAAIAAASTVIVPSALVAKGAFGPTEVSEIGELETCALALSARFDDVLAAYEPFDLGPECPEKLANEAMQGEAVDALVAAENRLIDYPVTTIEGLFAKALACQRAVNWELLHAGAAERFLDDIVGLAGGSHV